MAPGLVAEADGPRFLAAGDVSRVLCTLHDNTAEPGTVELVFECDGKTLARRSVELPAGGSTTVEEAVSVPEDAGEGVMHVSFRATGFGETRVSSFELPVRPALPPETRTVSAIVAPGAEAVLATPADLVAEDLRRAISSINLILGTDLGLDSETVLHHIFKNHCIGK